MISLILGSIAFLIIFGHIVVYIIARLTCGISRSSTCLVGKTAIVTGANSGLGYQTALNFASRGCKVIMADVANMDKSKQNIVLHTGNSNIITKRLDLSSLESVRELAKDIIKTEKRLDILINNAGIGDSNNNKTKDGLHPILQINYFGHFLLTHLLSQLLIKSAPSRIVFTSSISIFFYKLQLEDLQTSKKTLNINSAGSLYAKSKLALLIASDIFYEKLKEKGVTSNAVHPGCISTPIFSKMGSVNGKFFFKFLSLYFKIFGKTAWEGSQNIIHVAVSKKLQNVGGKFFNDCKPFLKPTQADDKTFCQNIWLESEKCVGLKPNELL